MRKLRFFLYSFLIVVIIILAYFYVVPFGKISYSQNFSKNYYNLLGGKGFFHKLGPVDRLFDNNKIIGDPVYFYLKTPRTFSKAKLKIKYLLSPELEKTNEYLNFEAGVLVDKENWHYDLKPIFNSALEQLKNSEDFNISREENLFFAQRKSVEQFSSAQEFLDKGNYREALFYNYSPAYNFKIIDSFSQNGVSSTGYFHYDIKTVLQNLRGSHVFYTYVHNEPLAIDFSWAVKEILNNKSDLELVNLFVYYQNEAIFSDLIEVKRGETKKYELNLPNLPAGAYKVEIKTSDNVISKKIETDLNKISFLNRVWLDGLTNGFTLYSNKNNFRIKSVDSDCLGELKVGSENILIDKIYQQFNFSLAPNKNKLNKIESNSCGLLLENTGLFAFSEIAFFNPLPEKLEADTNLANYNYIIANYQETEIEFDLSKSLHDKDGYRFLLSAPFLNSLNESRYIEIEKIEVDLEGRTLFSKLKSIFKK